MHEVVTSKNYDMPDHFQKHRFEIMYKRIVANNTSMRSEYRKHVI